MAIFESQKFAKVISRKICFPHCEIFMKTFHQKVEFFRQIEINSFFLHLVLHFHRNFVKSRFIFILIKCTFTSFTKFWSFFREIMNLDISTVFTEFYFFNHFFTKTFENNFNMVEKRLIFEVDIFTIFHEKLTVTVASSHAIFTNAVKTSLFFDFT